MSADLRPELPELPARIAALPRHRGYPVPWFVAWVGDPPEPEFRVMDELRLVEAIRDRLCWVCGKPLGGHFAYLVGPMCAVNRTSAEPPSHRGCAVFSASGCPFLTRPGMRRREGGIPEEAVEPAGIMLRRNPGVALVWVAKGRIRLRRNPAGGLLFNLDEPDEVLWFAEGRPATGAEVRASIDSGLPALREIAEDQGPFALRALDRALAAAEPLVPA